VNAARVSFHKESEGELAEITVWDESGKQADQYFQKVPTQQDIKLINYLAKHKHHSPFNHSFLTFRVKAPIFVARQLVKHKFMPWNEVSRRYVDEEPEFYFPKEWREYSENKKQGSAETLVEDAFDPELWARDSCIKALNTYQYLLQVNTCPEQARMILPQNMLTEWWWSGTLGAFLDMLKLRLDPHTQKETQEVAKMIAEKVYELFPVSYDAYLKEE
jgi:thymidylate synthase (FAD)